MTTDSVQSLRDAFPAAVQDVAKHNDRRIYATVAPEDAVDLCLHLFERCGARLAIITGLDLRSGVELLYHFMVPAEHRMVTVRTLVKKPAPEIRSLGAFLPAAIWIERELHDILGVSFTGHPDLRRLIMADDWPEHVYPLRREFKEPTP